MNRISWGLSLAILLLVLADILVGVRYQQAARFDQALQQIAGIDPEQLRDPRLLAARANLEAQKGHWQKALQLDTEALPLARGKVKQKLAYNLGTLYLQEASKRWQHSGVWEYSRVVTLLGLARENLREAVRLDPTDLDARYNLELALRIQPPPRERQPAKWQGHKASVFATLPGLPRGGP